MRIEGLVIVNKKVQQHKCNYEILAITTIDENGVYTVKNCKKGTEYLVTISPDTCTCTAYKFNGNDCKHINAIKAVIEDLLQSSKHMAVAKERTEELMVLD